MDVEGRKTKNSDELDPHFFTVGSFNILSLSLYNFWFCVLGYRRMVKDSYATTVILNQSTEPPVNTGRKLNVHKCSGDVLEVFWTSYVRSIYVLCLPNHYVSRSFGILKDPVFRSSRLEVFCKVGVLENFAKFTENHLWKSLVFNKVTGWGCFSTLHQFGNCCDLSNAGPTQYAFICSKLAIETLEQGMKYVQS